MPFRCCTQNPRLLDLCVLPGAESAAREGIDLEVDRGAAVQLRRIGLVLGHQVPGCAAATRGCRRAGNPAPAVAVEVDEAPTLVSAETRRGAARRDVGRVGLGVGHVPVRVQVGLLAARDQDAHGGTAAAGDDDSGGARRAGGTDLRRAIAARLAVKQPVLPSSGDRLSMDGGERGVGDGEREGRADGREERQDIVIACVHELAVACTGAVRESLARSDGAEELVVPADILCIAAGSAQWSACASRGWAVRT